ncbi:hypothetical protein HYC85_007956 [Camellia sinensis]|uniref:ABC transporter domain-containing protein n=1 Tax=Camellia sinensis TaxID=4442 RepID=A0A7J7HQF3_CAMSI|nr:hypothetical protein HYC85_007956 [Camellia sinensis]
MEERYHSTQQHRQWRHWFEDGGNKSIETKVFEEITVRMRETKQSNTSTLIKESNTFTVVIDREGVTEMNSDSQGEVLALMGPSDGGKTTLLNLHSGGVKLNSGTITYNQQPYTKSQKRRRYCVSPPDNTLSPEQKKERAMNVITELGLERCQDTIIGGAFVRVISGGERK